MQIQTLLVALDLIGTFVFALSGAVAGVKHQLDLFGVLVLSFAATAGGLTRDLLIGAVPLAAISNLPYIIVPVLAGLVVFWAPGIVRRLHHTVVLFDAAGLALFAVSGTQKALAFDLNPLAAVLRGVLTGIGGGMVRDLLVNEVPTVLRREIYAVAGLAGAAVVVLGDWLRLPPAPVAVTAALLCFGLRMVAIWRKWHLPIAEPPPGRTRDLGKRPLRWTGRMTGRAGAQARAEKSLGPRADTDALPVRESRRLTTILSSNPHRCLARAGKPFISS